ncbi:Filamentation temperature-sensitive H 2A isoform 1 [Zea mays]|uniref:Filamentation temperature-sensitive H 2A isoform 1 n=1 Tax=Zea mays TaxID=4577 RepID=A0A1D6P5R0_MAIZE|nr:Filamentation temperature-sensitive H 2A isoform 1 [Zea mays]
MAPPSMCLAAKGVLPFSALISSGVTQRPVSVTASLEHKTSDARRKFLKLALGNIGVGLPTLLGVKKALADEQGISSSRMSYSRFLEYLDKGRVKKVDLFENGTIAIVEAISPELGNRVQRVRVQLPGLSQELLQKLREKNIDFAAHSNQEDSGSLLFNLIGNLAFPLILIGGLFLLSRRAQGGLGGPNGPGFPLAMRTPGFSGADLANLLNEAAILAGRRGRTAISSKEIDDSIDRIVAGMEGTVMTDGKSKSLVAYHEVGHAICGTLTPGHDPVQKVTLIPRGQARGLTWFIPMDDPTLISRQQLFARIVGGLGGRAAEEVIFGEPEVTTGAAGDLQQITGLAKQMVVTFGMSEIGPWSLMEGGAQSGDVIMRMMARNSMSEKLAEDIDSAVKQLSDEAYEIALRHIRNNREAIDKIVEVLIEKETLAGDEFRAILSEFVEIPVENRVPPATPAAALPA